MVLGGNCALESMGFKTFWGLRGREDIWEPESDINWGSEIEWLGAKRYDNDRQLQKPFGAVQMGLIYVNPEGPEGKPDPLAAASHIREFPLRPHGHEAWTRRRWRRSRAATPLAKPMALPTPPSIAAPNPRVPASRNKVSAGEDSFGTGKARRHDHQLGLEGTWTSNPVEWDNGFFDNLFGHEWELTKSPAGAFQWTPKDASAQGTVPDAHDPSKRHAPMMFTTDLALRPRPHLRTDFEALPRPPGPVCRGLCQGLVQTDPPRYGPRRAASRPAGCPAAVVARPCPRRRSSIGRRAGHRSTQDQNLRIRTGPFRSLVTTAWASASSFRSTDKRGGANGARIRPLCAQKNWEVNQPDRAREGTGGLLEKVQKGIQQARKPAASKVSLADVIVLEWVRARRLRRLRKTPGTTCAFLFARERTERIAGDDRRGAPLPCSN